MAVTALLDLRLDPASVEAAHAILKETLTDTRAFPGCLGVRVMTDAADPAHVILVEEWASAQDDAAYRAWRAGQGASRLGTVLTGPPSLTVLNLEPGI